MNFWLCTIKYTDRLTHTQNLLIYFQGDVRVFSTRIANHSTSVQSMFHTLILHYLFNLMAFILFVLYTMRKIIIEHMYTWYQRARTERQVLIRARAHALTHEHTFTRCQWSSTKDVRRNGEKKKRDKNGAAEIGWIVTSTKKNEENLRADEMKKIKNRKKHCEY